MVRFDLGLSSKEFYELQPRQIDALIKRCEVERRTIEFMIAQLTACTINSSMGRPKDGVKTQDFMPSEWAKKRKRKEPATPKPKRRERKVIADEIRGVMDQFMRPPRRNG